MIIVINSQGKVVSQQNDDIFQGSVKANVIDLVAPFAENVDFYATFELPDGRLLPEKLKYGYLMNRSVKVVDGLNVWKLAVNFPITQLHGIVTIQLKGVIGNQIVCTSSIKVNVQKGVPYINEEEDLEPSQYDVLSGMIQDIRSILAGKVDKEHLKLNLVEVNEDTVGYYYIINEEGQLISVVLPEQYDESEKYYIAEKTGRIVNDDNGIYIEYLDGEKRVKIELLNDKVLINNEKVIVETDLIAENIKYNDNYSQTGVDNVQKAIENLTTKIESSQVIDIGQHMLVGYKWEAKEDYYEYRFTHRLLTDALTQSLIITPEAYAINKLNDNDILIYPEIDIEQESEGVAVAIIRADKRPGFNIVANFKIQGITVNSNIEGVKANQILFTPTGDLTSETVQKAIEEVQDNLDDFENIYSTDKTKYVKLDENGKVPASQLPAYVDDVIECYLHNGAMYLTRTGAGTDDEPYVYADTVVPVSGKIYIDLQTNKQYRWSGSQYTIISESLALGETSSTAYSGAKGKENADKISNIIYGTQIVGNAKKINGKEIKQDENGVLKCEDIIIPCKKLIYNATTFNNSTTEAQTIVYNEPLSDGDKIEIEYRATGGLRRYHKMAVQENSSESILVNGTRIVHNDGTYQVSFRSFESSAEPTRFRFWGSLAINTYWDSNEKTISFTSGADGDHYIEINKIYKIIE